MEGLAVFHLSLNQVEISITQPWSMLGGLRKSANLALAHHFSYLESKAEKRLGEGYKPRCIRLGTDAVVVSTIFIKGMVDAWVPLSPRLPPFCSGRAPYCLQSGVPNSKPLLRAMRLKNGS